MRQIPNTERTERPLTRGGFPSMFTDGAFVNNPPTEKKRIRKNRDPFSSLAMMKIYTCRDGERVSRSGEHGQVPRSNVMAFLALALINFPFHPFLHLDSVEGQAGIIWRK